MKYVNVTTLILILISLCFQVDNAFALQVHPEPEGLYVHQIAHLLFAFAMLFLLLFLHKYPLGTGKGWFYFKLSLLFFLIWNINGFIGHWMETKLPDDAVTKVKPFFLSFINLPLSSWLVLYYTCKLDHLWCVPAMFFLVLALKHFCTDAIIKKQTSISQDIDRQ